MTDPLNPILLHAADGISAYDDRATFKTVESAVLQLWDVVDNLTRIYPPKHERYRVTIFGSARLHPEDLLYTQVRQLASELTAMGCDIVTGGGPGLMQAANEGSVIADPENLTQSIGVRIALEQEQQANPFVEEVYHHRTFFSRLHHFVVLSDAFVVVPGGIGTTLETMMVWQLLQVRKLHHVPLILVGSMWVDLVDWAERHMVEVTPPLANAVDVRIPTCVETCSEAIALLQQYQTQWQNTRVVNPQCPTPESI
ncbi:MAG TPA: lysine decarboxylase [Cyanobacteria bacterium UBA11372]|nr:lysine decarboxylase [Cyanobacteria bacterium UBA11372]